MNLHSSNDTMEDRIAKEDSSKEEQTRVYKILLLTYARRLSKYQDLIKNIYFNNNIISNIKDKSNDYLLNEHVASQHYFIDTLIKSNESYDFIKSINIIEGNLGKKENEEGVANNKNEVSHGERGNESGDETGNGVDMVNNTVGSESNETNQVNQRTQFNNYVMDLMERSHAFLLLKILFVLFLFEANPKMYFIVSGLFILYNRGFFDFLINNFNLMSSNESIEQVLRRINESRNLNQGTINENSDGRSNLNEETVQENCTGCGDDPGEKGHHEGDDPAKGDNSEGYNAWPDNAWAGNAGGKYARGRLYQGETYNGDGHRQKSTQHNLCEEDYSSDLRLRSSTPRGINTSEVKGNTENERRGVENEFPSSSLGKMNNRCDDHRVDNESVQEEWNNRIYMENEEFNEESMDDIINDFDYEFIEEPFNGDTKENDNPVNRIKYIENLRKRRFFLFKKKMKEIEQEKLLNRKHNPCEELNTCQHLSKNMDDNSVDNIEEDLINQLDVTHNDDNINTLDSGIRRRKINSKMYIQDSSTTFNNLINNSMSEFINSDCGDSYQSDAGESNYSNFSLKNKSKKIPKNVEGDKKNHSVGSITRRKPTKFEKYIYQSVVMFFMTLLPWWVPDVAYLED
ncbi:hypothetical protein POVWA2_057110 [Plasmodium ovale wallikeri]|uniref:Uncharacterized protein n=2 Tax=Plasmodium ovale TaxID=36330 RepID=A0A1A8ZX54_PLAOA|nr:hypothetical protein POVWA1_057760 [Plasmodium ovale wallikeri]SBT48947.1 hypothetical protein POVWA2_057110 [Plasmodium ovale wallikeri]SBT82490.1 conserved Plasmodium protein, unknown function [Plasmodium ovale]